MFEYQGRTAVITGAGSGFGLEFARVAHKRGMNLVLADVQQDALEAARAEFENAGAQVLAQRVDVSKDAEVQALAEATFARFGVPHLLFNNAGVGYGGLVWEAPLSDWEWVLGVNMWGVIHGMRAFVPAMVKASRQDPAYRGHVVNTASIAGMLNPPNMGVYSASKEAVVSLSESLYRDLDLVGVNVGASVLCPHFVLTGIIDGDRNRPGGRRQLTAAQEAGRVRGRQAIAAAKVSAADVAQMTFDAIDEGRFYIYSQPDELDSLKARMKGMLETGHPADLFAARPEAREEIRKQIWAREEAA